MSKAKSYFITGGAGFIGVNYSARLLNRQDRLVIFDNLSRPGVDTNLEWLKKEFGPERFTFVKGDIRDFAALQKAMQQAAPDVVAHLAAQVAVTRSVTDPREDFEINALGTLNVLEAARSCARKPHILYSSTNKVFGGLEDLAVKEGERRYDFVSLPFGVSESHPLDFHSPYGCSKGAGDQYVRDYARIFDLSTTVLRQSCIYGTHQFGIEDQGWVAWFMIRALKGEPFTIYGNGKQVRDLLYVDDLLDAFDLVIAKPEISSGKIYNVGGGPANSMSVWHDFGPILEKYFPGRLKMKYSDWRPGDQKIFISDIRKIKEELGWAPKVSIAQGLESLFNWLTSIKSLPV